MLVISVYEEAGGYKEMSSSTLLTNRALVYKSKWGGMRGVCGVSANEYSCAHHVTWSPKTTSMFNLCEEDFSPIFYHSNKERNIEKMCTSVCLGEPENVRVDNESAIIRWTLPDPILPVGGGRGIMADTEIPPPRVWPELRMWKHECRGVEKLWTWHHILSHG